MGTSLLRQSIGCLATDVMPKGLGAILSTGESLSANSAGAPDFVRGAVLGFEAVMCAQGPRLFFLERPLE
jgi:hypothetical protein